MRACVQRVSQSEVTVNGESVGRIGVGLLVLLGVAGDDTDDDAGQLAAKLLGLRIFDDAEGKMNLSVQEIGGKLLVVSQFTLLGDCRKGRRPSFIAAAPPELAERLYQVLVDQLRAQGAAVETGRFRTQMAVHLVNDGPVTLLLDTRRTF